jgi:hypothetical protein
MMKTFLLLTIVVLSSRGFSKSCEDNIVAYNLNYSKQLQNSDARTLFNSKFSRFLDENTAADVRNLSYYLSTRLFHPQSNDDNFFDISEVLKSGIPLKPDDDAVVRGHSFVNLSGLKEDKNLKEMAKFLYIQVFTNSDLKRAASNLNDLTDCRAWHIFH